MTVTFEQSDLYNFTPSSSCFSTHLEISEIIFWDLPTFKWNASVLFYFFLTEASCFSNKSILFLAYANGAVSIQQKQCTNQYTHLP